MESNEILGGLEEVGLSKYESSAYYNLLGKGMISAAEIAYCSNLPRTKNYSVLNKFSTTNKLIELIRKSKESIYAMINPWGNKLLIYSKDDLVKTIIEGVSVKIICDDKCEFENKILPNAIEQRFSKIATNV